jgi:hypothetical protein
MNIKKVPFSLNKPASAFPEARSFQEFKLMTLEKISRLLEKYGWVTWAKIEGKHSIWVQTSDKNADDPSVSILLIHDSSDERFTSCLSDAINILAEQQQIAPDLLMRQAQG